MERAEKLNSDCLNPFGTGRGLSTFRTTVFERNQSLNPFGTGRGLSTHVRFESEESKQSQSLWNRAGSFDAQENYNARKDMGSQSLWNRAGSFDDELELIFENNDVSIPLEQGGVFRLQGWFGALVDKA